MILNYSLFNLLILAGAPATALSLKHARTNSVKWGPCSEALPSSLPIECGNLTVPLDYANPNSTKTLELELLKVPALKGPSKGSILFNFGGPGLGTRASLADRAYLLQAVTGGNHDLVTWDPRGTVNTTTFNCYSGALAAFKNISPTGASGNTSDPVLLGRNWASATILADMCQLNPDSNEKGGLIGTAYTVRDMMQIVDAIEDDGLLRYFGTSYGTIIGATAAAMFPDRVGKVLLDSVVNPHEWYNYFEVEMSADADATLLEFCRACLQTPTKCALARGNATAEGLQQKILTFVDEAKFRPVVMGPFIVDHDFMSRNIRPALYNPAHWPFFAAWLDALFTGDMIAASAHFLVLVARFPAIQTGAGVGDDSAVGIQCIDKIPRVDSLDKFLPVVDDFTETSRSIGQNNLYVAMACAQWKIEAKETYKGDFNVKTKNPLFIFSNSYDPATPLRSAQNVSAGFEGSVLLQSEGFGHGWRTHPSVCVAKAIQKYFDEGVLPEPGTKCKTDVAAFDVTNTSWDALLPEIGFDTQSKRSVQLFA